ncbi:MAG: DUF983 domain-containing protein [Saprospiraceae bacterium]
MSLKSILNLQCPACEVGYLFIDEKNKFSFKFKMNARCKVCNENLFREPGFYFGSMFISYVISGIMSLIFVGILIIFLKIDWIISLGILFAVLFLLYAYLFKVSRAIWIHLFVKKRIV